MDLDRLETLGFKKKEAKIYLTLLELEESQAGEISKKTQINRTTVYDELESLIGKGLVKFTIQSNKKIFRPVKPKVILEQIKRKQDIAEQILPELNNIYKKNKEKEEHNIFKGRKGIISILQDILNYNEYLAFGSSGKFLETMKYDFIIFQKQKKKLKINARVILSQSSKNSEQVKLAYSKFRYIPDEYTAPTTTFVYGDNVTIIIWGAIPTAMHTSSKELSKSYKNYFNLLWKIAKS